MKYYYDFLLISQDYNKGCWAASIRMIYKAAGLPNPIGADIYSLVKKLYKGSDAPHEIPYILNIWEPDDSEILEVLEEVGLKPVPVQPKTYAAQWLKNNLPDYGPMFAAGVWVSGFHAVVIYGVEDDPKEPKPILIKDPWPPGQGGLMPSISLGDFNAKKNPRVPLHYLPRPNWRRLCKGLPARLGGPNP